MTPILDDPTQRSSPHTPAIAGMEVWGGSRAFGQPAFVPGNDVRTSCTPFRGEAPKFAGMLGRGAVDSGPELEG